MYLLFESVVCIFCCKHAWTQWCRVTCWNGLEELWKGSKVFGNVFKIWHKNISGIAAFLEMWHAAIIIQRFPCILKMANSLRKALQAYSEIAMYFFEW